MNNKIYIILPVFNRLLFTKRCIASIYKQNYKNFSLILIDDGSTDGTSEFVKLRYPKTQIIIGNGNWWWTRSMFEGVKKALKEAKRTDYILEMNNDLYFNKNYFSELVRFAKKFPHSLVGSICVRSQKPAEVVEAGIRIDWPTGLVYGVAQTISQRLTYYKNMEVIKDLDALPGKGTLIPIEVFKQVGNFNYKKLPHYIADYEFAARAKKAGFDLLVDPKAVAKHYWEATGIFSNKDNETWSYKKAYQLLFSKKSMNNIKDWVTFIFLTCPKEFVSINLYFSLIRIVRAAFSVFPFYFLRPYLKTFLKIYYWTKLKTYVLYLKIKQFPEYHKLVLYRIFLKIKQFPKYHLQ